MSVHLLQEMLSLQGVLSLIYWFSYLYIFKFQLFGYNGLFDADLLESESCNYLLEELPLAPRELPPELELELKPPPLLEPELKLLPELEPEL